MKLSTRFLLPILIAFVAAIAHPQAPTDCPKLEVVGPSGITTRGGLAVFTLEPDLPNSDRLQLEWTVSLGKIEEGQGSHKIVVLADTDKLIASITATVTVTGLPQGCRSTASETAGVAEIIDNFPIDEWGKLPVEDQLGRLDLAASEWKRRPTFILYFIVYLAQNETSASERARIKRITDHLTKTRKIPKDHVVIVKGGKERESRTVIYFLPPGADSPHP